MFSEETKPTAGLHHTEDQTGGTQIHVFNKIHRKINTNQEINTKTAKKKYLLVRVLEQQFASLANEMGCVDQEGRLMRQKLEDMTRELLEARESEADYREWMHDMKKMMANGKEDGLAMALAENMAETRRQQRIIKDKDEEIRKLRADNGVARSEVTATRTAKAAAQTVSKAKSEFTGGIVESCSLWATPALTSSQPRSSSASRAGTASAAPRSTSASRASSASRAASARSTPVAKGSSVNAGTAAAAAGTAGRAPLPPRLGSARR